MTNLPGMQPKESTHPLKRVSSDYQILTPEELDHSTLRRTAVVLRQ
jgi:hypothetical protein